MFYYTIHGLLVESNLALPSLESVRIETLKIKKIDLIIEKVSDNSTVFNISNDELPDSDSTIKTSQKDISINIKNIAKYRIKNGRKIYIKPYKDAPRQSIQLYLLGSIFAVALHQRELLVLHANAIVIEDRVVLFMGDSGAGKSTTAAIFQQKGYSIISDDVVAINNKGLIEGGFPQIKLYGSSLEQLDIPSKGLTNIHEQKGKFILPITKLTQHFPIKIAAIYKLNVSSQESISPIKIVPIEGMNRFRDLVNNTYRNEYITGMDLKNEHLDLCSTISKAVHMSEITRPTSYFSGHELLDAILFDLKKNGILKA